MVEKKENLNLLSHSRSRIYHSSSLLCSSSLNEENFSRSWLVLMSLFFMKPTHKKIENIDQFLIIEPLRGTTSFTLHK